MRIEPYTYQVKGVRQIHRFGGRALLADEQGLGKTVSALLYLTRHPEVRPVVVVCPASLKWNWEKEAAEKCGWRADVLSSTRAPEKPPLGASWLCVINYEILGPWLPYLLSLRPQMVILDECQYIAGRTTKRTKAVRVLCSTVPKLLALSGTPLTNRPKELFPVLNLLRPDLFPSFLPFAFQHCGAKRTPWGWDYSGATKLKTLHKKLTTNLMIRRRKEDVLEELPPKTRSVVPLEISDRRQYDHALKDFLGWLAGKDPSRIHTAERAEALVKVGYLKRLAGELKVKSVLSWADAFLRGCERKLVLFAVHRHVVGAVQKHYRGLCVTLDGSTPQKRRKLAVDRFQNDRDCRVFLGNVRAAGVGITLTAASDLAFLEYDWVPGVHAQAEDRIHRIGQANTASIYYLTAHGTIEEDLARIVQEKQQVLSAVLDDAGGEQLDVFDQLLAKIRGD